MRAGRSLSLVVCPACSFGTGGDGSLNMGRQDDKTTGGSDRVRLVLDGVRTQRIVNGDMQVSGKLRIVNGTHSATDAVTVHGRLVEHRFTYNSATGHGCIGHLESAIVPIATCCNVLQGGDDVLLPLDVTVPLPQATFPSTTWELQLTAFLGETPIPNSVSAWLGPRFRPQAWEGFLQDETVCSDELAPGVELRHIQGHLPEGPLQMWLAEIDVTDPRIHIDALHADQPFPDVAARWPRSVVSHMLAASGGIAAINASLFEINYTMNPRGMRIQNGKPLKSANPGWQSSVGFTTNNTPFFGSWQLYSGIRRVSGEAYRPIATFSTTGTGVDELGLFAWPWEKSPGCDFAVPSCRSTGNKTTSVVELVLTDVEELECKDSDRALPDRLPKTTRFIRAKVSEIRQQQPGIAIEQGIIVITGYGEAASYLLDTYQVGDQVELLYSVSGDTGWPGLTDWRQLHAVVSGNMALLRNGDYGDARVHRLTDRHPHTAVAATCDQRTLFWLVVDGRSEQSIGMTYKELADFFLYIGAFHALNCDGGGSSTLAVRDACTMQVQIINHPSDGEQRPVPDGLVIRYDNSCTGKSA